MMFGWAHAAAERLGVVAEPEVIVRHLGLATAFVVLASDGVFEFMSNQEVVGLVSARTQAMPDALCVPLRVCRGAAVSHSRSCRSVWHAHEPVMCPQAAAFEDPQEAAVALVVEAYRLWLQYETRTDDITAIVIQARSLGGAPCKPHQRWRLSGCILVCGKSRVPVCGASFWSSKFTLFQLARRQTRAGMQRVLLTRACCLLAGERVCAAAFWFPSSLKLYERTCQHFPCGPKYVQPSTASPGPHPGRPRQAASFKSGSTARRVQQRGRSASMGLPCDLGRSDAAQQAA